MVGLLQTVGHLLPYHLFSYGALLGTELFQTFVNTKLCFKYLPMREFLVLQKRVFPIYFASQVGLVVLTAATHPPYSIFSLVADTSSTVSLAVVLVTGLLNWAVYGPRTTTASFVRRAVHAISSAPWVLSANDGVEAHDKQENGVEDQEKVNRANKTFKFNHAMSIHLNAIALTATVWYGISLSSHILSGL
ncbi:uncharacterized protein N7469_010961 [Penicillium citrinum]|uniref:TMEM205-like domain-containing protein n=1 Tax=Penicillium citrinum TaxID=5077 RepID=A0A9W9NL76_PENCI|nr:uncharacterized protein N7469_010961 [Penicillium citrinum]KAJ5222074.1 hypothetical protein N7469_010961 [Penicillium citrinum]KAK5797426.1 hypothetical protein VI817_003717 [Penicillium citrinum]